MYAHKYVCDPLPCILCDQPGTGHMSADTALHCAQALGRTLKCMGSTHAVRCHCYCRQCPTVQKFIQRPTYSGRSPRDSTSCIVIFAPDLLWYQCSLNTMSTYPRKPTQEEKREIAEIVFPDKPFESVDFTDVWMLADLYPTELDFNCFGWSLLVPQTISIPDRLDTLYYLAERAKQQYGAPYNYMPTTLGASNAVITAWGDGPNDVMHVSRICSKSLLEQYAKEFNLKFDFDSPSAAGFPSSIWSSKFGDRQAFTTHPRDWLSGGVWGTAQGDLRQQ